MVDVFAPRKVLLKPSPNPAPQLLPIPELKVPEPIEDILSAPIDVLSPFVENNEYNAPLPKPLFLDPARLFVHAFNPMHVLLLPVELFFSVNGPKQVLFVPLVFVIEDEYPILRFLFDVIIILPEQLISLLNVFIPVHVFDVGKIDVPDKPVGPVAPV